MLQKRPLLRNWKVLEERKSWKCLSLSEASHLTDNCNVIFNASVGEMFLPITWKAPGEVDYEKMFISRRLSTIEDNDLAEDLICTGCHLCGLPLDSRYRYGRDTFAALQCFLYGIIMIMQWFYHLHIGLHLSKTLFHSTVKEALIVYMQ